MITLHKELGTVYIIDSFTMKMDKILSESEDIIDLCYCKFSPSAEKVLRKYYATKEFRNTINPVLDAYLQHNMRAARASQKESVKLSTGFGDMAELKAYLKTLDHSKIYNLEDAHNPMYLALATLIMMKFPDITFDLQNKADILFDFIRKDWLRASVSHESYWEAEGSSLWKRDIVRGKVYIPGEGDLKESTYVSRYKVIPYEFGTKVLWGHPEFTYLETTIINNLFAVQVKKKGLLDYVETYKRSV